MLANLTRGREHLRCDRGEPALDATFFTPKRRFTERFDGLSMTDEMAVRERIPQLALLRCFALCR